MQEIDLLKQLFDEKIVKILGIFAKYPERKFYLTELTKLSKVNVSTTFRILNKLVEKEFIESMVIGRTRFYHLNNNEKTQKIIKLLQLRKDTLPSSPINNFIEQIRQIGRIKKVILKSKSSKGATLILIGDFIPMERVSRAINDVKSKSDFEISAVDLSNRQFDALYNISELRKMGKVLFERNKEDDKE